MIGIHVRYLFKKKNYIDLLIFQKVMAIFIKKIMKNVEICRFQKSQFFRTLKLDTICDLLTYYSSKLVQSDLRKVGDRHKKKN